MSAAAPRPASRRGLVRRRDDAARAGLHDSQPHLLALERADRVLRVGRAAVQQHVRPEAIDRQRRRAGANSGRRATRATAPGPDTRRRMRWCPRVPATTRGPWVAHGNRRNAPSRTSRRRCSPNQLAAAWPSSLASTRSRQTVTSADAPCPMRCSGTASFGRPGAVSSRRFSTSAVPTSARRGSSRCVRKRPLGDTTIHSRSYCRPRGVSRACWTAMPRHDLTG